MLGFITLLIASSLSRGCIDFTIVLSTTMLFLLATGIYCPIPNYLYEIKMFDIFRIFLPTFGYCYVVAKKQNYDNLNLILRMLYDFAMVFTSTNFFFNMSLMIYPLQYYNLLSMNLLHGICLLGPLRVYCRITNK